MICPKCGFEQDDRLDCRKCGIVFSKYWAMQSESPAPVVQPIHPPAEIEPAVELSELRQTVRDLGRRFSEVEFERLERGQLRGEVKGLDKKFQGGFDQLSLRLEELEKLISNPQVPPALPDGTRILEVQKELIEANVDPLAARMTNLESKLEHLENELLSLRNSIGPEISHLLETAHEKLSGKIDGLDERLQVKEMESFMQGGSGNVHAMDRFESRLADIENKMPLSQAVSSGEESAAAQKELQDHLRSLSDEVAAAKSSIEKLPGLQQEIAEVQSEFGKIRFQLQDFEGRLSRPSAPAVDSSVHDRLELDIRSIRENMQEIREFITRIASRG